MAAWAIFLLLAGGLTGYVVVFSDTPDNPSKVAEDQASDQDDSGGEEPAMAASKPSLAVADKKTAPSADEGATDDQPLAKSSAAESGDAPPDPQPPGSEASQEADASEPDQQAPSSEEVSETAASDDDVMTPVAATAEVNGHSFPDTAPDTAADHHNSSAEASEEVSEAASPPDQPTTTAKELQPKQETVPPAPTVDQAATEQSAAEPTQLAFRAPEPAPSTEDTPPWQRYAAYFLHEDTRPRVAIIMTGLGMSDGITEAAIKSLPAEVTLSFSPYARNLASWIGLARVNGHEVLLDLYMEPSTYPLDDPGPQAIMTVLSEDENRKRFNWVLSRGNSYVGLTGRLGSRLLTRRRSLAPVMQDIADHGLLFVDDRATAGSLGFGLAQDLSIPAAYSEGLIDEPSANRAAIDAKLNRIERIALTKGAAVALAQPYPVTIERLNAWIEELSSRGVALAPITAVVNRQPPLR